MTHPEIEYQMMMERRRDEMAMAEHSRLVKIALEASQENRVPGNLPRLGDTFQMALRLIGQGLYQVGVRIQGWGCQLQVRYATAAPGRQAAPCK
jgi:hypothetical protein